MKAQFITTPNGEELAILPRADYEALVAAAADAEEDAADAAIYDACKAASANDPNSVLPAEVSAFMLRGERLATAIRKWRGLTQQDVAAKLGMAQGTLSDIENGRHRTAVNTVRALAKIYDVPEDWLMAVIGPLEAQPGALT
ncbi:helix-turn-helix domain-containing protein [Methylosinus sporium]|uniref:XRE family transcriptional regulator n=1 Tax=Methylosinus sporium TaxID=428 RepID=A0A2U1SRP7_METSR|nr:helix-turn-helix transcriptional regulator [Methylosinus sporium]PWB94286.1 XRE family transcriptional regulator [Methylosinus sporium]